LAQEQITSSESHKFVTIRSAPGGIMHLTYRRDHDAPGKVYYATHDGVAWSSSETVYEYDGRYLYEPDLSIDSSGNAHAVWTQDSFRCEYSTNASGSWSGPTMLEFGWNYSPQVAAYSPNNVHVVWEKDNDIYYNHYDGSSWSTEVKLNEGSGNANKPYMRMGLDGRIHLVYHQWDGSDWQIQYMSR
jgi:hypothetical protein